MLSILEGGLDCSARQAGGIHALIVSSVAPSRSMRHGRKRGHAWVHS